MIYNDDELEFKKKIIDIKNNVEKNDKTYLLNFLNLREQEIIKDIIRDDKVSFNGGYNDAEYKRCIISNYQTNSFNIIIFRINYNKKYLHLTHKKVLGSVLSLGIKRDVIGDIIISDFVYMIVKSEFRDFLLDNFKVIDNTPIELEEYLESIEKQEDYKMEIIYVKSLRLDIVISHAYNISRKETSELIYKGFVKINQKIVENTSQIINNCDIISIRKYGRLKIFENKGKTKSDNFVLQIGKL